MSMNSTPAAERVHIAFFGRRNAGKSSVVNAVTGQSIAIVSDIKGTTTDPVSKSMELLPLGPVVIIDTPGIDDDGALGELRVQRTRRVLNRSDIAVLVVDGTVGLQQPDAELLALFKEKSLPHLVVWNKRDLCPEAPLPEGVLPVSARTGEGVDALKEALARLGKSDGPDKRLIGDLVQAGDYVLLITPIDKAAPKGRLILPQQQTIRDLLESGAIPIVARETEIAPALAGLARRPALAITDSQVFKRADAEVPQEIPLTSFSILMARYKGFLDAAVHGVAAIDRLRDGDAVLISEGCTHHRQCGDIGTVKLPAWLKKHTGRELALEFTSGTEFPEDVRRFKLVIHCGGCMLNEREMQYRMKCSLDQGVPFTNYGTAIAFLQGILPRSLEIFPALRAALGDMPRT